MRCGWKWIHSPVAGAFTMRRFTGFALTFACFACAAHAEDGEVARAKAAALPAPSFAASAMATLPAHAAGGLSSEPTHATLPAELARAERERNSSQGRCELSGSTVCYDLTGRRIVIAAARGYMPRIEGLKAESLSVRSRGIVLRYSFK
jgi:hypothetical protein